MRFLLITLYLITLNAFLLFAQSNNGTFRYDSLEAQNGKTILTFKLTVDSIPPDQYDDVISKSTISAAGKVICKVSQYLHDAIPPARATDFKDNKLFTIDLSLIESFFKKEPPFVISINKPKGKTTSITVNKPADKPADNPNPSPADTSKPPADKDRDLVLKELKDLLNDLEPKWKFIDKEMFLQSDSWGFSEMKRCAINKKDRKLPGEYILLYDMKNGDYYTLKKKIRARSTADAGLDAKECKWIEYYKWKKSIFFTPPAGSQFKVQLMNVNATESLQLAVSYKDNFLEDEATFKSTAQAFSNRANETANQPAGSKATPPVPGLQGLNPKEKAENLIALRNDLDYYNKNFYYNSATAEKHRQNLITIHERITKTFGTDLAGLLAKYLITMDKDDDLNVLMKKIRDTYTMINNKQAQVFTAFKLKNNDYLELQFKDNAGNIKREEEIRLSGGLKIDFSSGIGLTGLKDYTYILKDTTVAYKKDALPATEPRDTTGKIIRRENDGKVNVIFGVYMHVYPRLTSNYNAALTIGITTNTNLDINFITGGSLLLGSNRRLVLTGGLVWGKVNRLSNSVEEGYHEIPVANGTVRPVFIPTGTSVVPVVKQWNHSWVFGISWNFTK